MTGMFCDYGGHVLFHLFILWLLQPTYHYLPISMSIIARDPNDTTLSIQWWGEKSHCQNVSL